MPLNPPARVGAGSTDDLEIPGLISCVRRSACWYVDGNRNLVGNGSLQLQIGSCLSNSP